MEDISVVIFTFLTRAVAFEEGADFPAASMAWDAVGILVKVMAASMEVSAGAGSALVCAFSAGEMPVAIYIILS